MFPLMKPIMPTIVHTVEPLYNKHFGKSNSLLYGGFHYSEDIYMHSNLSGSKKQFVIERRFAIRGVCNKRFCCSIYRIYGNTGNH